MTKKILIVDFDPASIDQLRDMFDDDAFDVSTASSGEIAWDMLTSQHFDLVVSEIVLPRLHGFQLAKAIAEELPNCRSIIVSGVFKGDIYRRQALYQYKAGDYLEKPLDKIELKKCVAALLGIPEEELSGIVEEVVDDVVEEVVAEVVEAVAEEDASPLKAEQEITIEFSEHSTVLEKAEPEQRAAVEPPAPSRKKMDIDALLEAAKKGKPGTGNYKKIDSEISRKIEDALSDLGIKM